MSRDVFQLHNYLCRDCDALSHAEPSWERARSKAVAAGWWIGDVVRCPACRRKHAALPVCDECGAVTPAGGGE